ncbi:S24 family peptidase [Legionella quinlivanii]|uniref:S24 family peptidase n=1 Tax=Legionella quinlivanii TaxID=45073 RepID=UPI002242DB88|nr:S24 family peptidase [Legionella quinlivanii]MCW8451907.1 helix-turn-helix domain-containing protein [Legionella quinlivanii]
MSIGKIIDGLMHTYNINALELERLTGIPSSTIYRLLKGKNINPTIEILKKLANFFHITVSQLIGEESLNETQIPILSSLDIEAFIINNYSSNENHKFVSVDFPVSPICFATVAEDNMMEPFIMAGSLIIVDPAKHITAKDFIVILKKDQGKPKIRQAIVDGDEIYLKTINPDFSKELELFDKTNYMFCGCVIHYRTNLLDFNATSFKLENKKQVIGA